jgi:hypothetical protein
LSVQNSIGSSKFRRIDIHENVLAKIASTLAEDLKKREESCRQLDTLWSAMPTGSEVIAEELAKMGPKPTMRSRVKYWLNDRVREIFSHVRAHHEKANPVKFSIGKDEDQCMQDL